MKFGEKIKELRTNKGLTQPQLAESLGLSLRTVKNYELGTSLPRTRDIYQKLATFFNVNINYLLTEDDSFILNAGSAYGTGLQKKRTENILLKNILIKSNFFLCVHFLVHIL